MKHEWTRINVVRITDFVEFVIDIRGIRGQCFSVSVFQTCLPGKAARKVAGLPAREGLYVKGQACLAAKVCVLRS